MEKLSYWLPFTDEMLIDAGLATAEVIERDARRRAESRARWLSTPWYRRAWIVGRARWWGVRLRLEHAARALRGIDCE